MLKFLKRLPCISQVVPGSGSHCSGSGNSPRRAEDTPPVEGKSCGLHSQQSKSLKNQEATDGSLGPTDSPALQLAATLSPQRWLSLPPQRWLSQLSKQARPAQGSQTQPFPRLSLGASARSFSHSSSGSAGAGGSNSTVSPLVFSSNFFSCSLFNLHF